MAEKKRVLILVGIPDFDYSNEKSAVLTFLKTIRSAFESVGYLVEFPDESKNYSKGNDSTPNQQGVKSKLKKWLKKWPWLYQSIAYQSYFKRQDALLIKLKKRKKFDLIVEFHTAGSVIGRELSLYWNCAFSMIFDSPVDEQFYEMHGTKSIYWNRIKKSEQLSLEAAGKIMCYSPSCKEHIMKKYSIAGVIMILPSALTKNAVARAENIETFNIGFIGSFLIWHKVSELVYAFKKLISKYPNSKLQLIGYGAEWENVKRLVADLGLEKSVDLPGFLSEEGLDEYKANFSVAVMPGSNWYGSPLKLFEYAKVGVPFIAPESKTVRSIFIEGKHCLYVDSKDVVKSLFEHLEFVYNNPSISLEMAKEAQLFVQNNYEGEIYSNKILEALNA